MIGLVKQSMDARKDVRLHSKLKDVESQPPRDARRVQRQAHPSCSILEGILRLWALGGSFDDGGLGSHDVPETFTAKERYSNQLEVRMGEE